MRYSYITVLDPSFYPRPYFFFKCCRVPTYFLRTFIGYLRNPKKDLGPERGDNKTSRPGATR
jgi:hypothetical protein